MGKFSATASSVISPSHIIESNNPTPTIWNSHCIASFDEAGDEYYEAYEDKEIQQIAWSKYGFRTGVTGGNYDVTQVNVKGIPQSIISTVSSLKMNVYEQLISYLGNK